MGRQDIVRSAADVTPEWITEVLAGTGALAGGRVVGVTASPVGTGQMADTARLALTYDRAGAGPPSVVGKFASSDEQSRATGLALRAYEIEVRFYQEVATRVAARVPALFAAEVEQDTGWFTLILEDIVGARQGDESAAFLAEMLAQSLLADLVGFELGLGKRACGRVAPRRRRGAGKFHDRSAARRRSACRQAVPNFFTMAWKIRSGLNGV